MRSVASAPSGPSGKGAKSQAQNQDLDMNGHNILNAPTYMAGAAGTTNGAIRLYTNSNSNFATITSASQGANRTYTIPDAGSDATFVMQTGSQTISGLKTFSAGATMGSSVNMSSNRIMNLSTPTSSSDAATKGYVDAINTTLTNSINQEITDRQTAISGEASARTSADNALTSSINNESSARQSADNTLTSSINSETSRAQAAEATLTSSVSSEASTRQSADNALTTSISDEATARASAVTAEANARTASENRNTQSVNSEAARALAAGGTLTTNLNNEITNRTNAVTSEANTRAAAVTTVTNNLNAEVTARINALSSEANTRSAADNTLTSSINNEVSRATTEENDLQSQIDGLSMPQDLSQTAAPTFDGLTLSGSANNLYNYGMLGQFAPSYFFSDLSIFANIVMGGTIDAGF